MRAIADDLAGEIVKFCDAVYLVAKKFDADPALARRRRHNLDTVAAHTKRAALKIDVIALVLDLDQLAQHIVALHFLSRAQVQHLVFVELRRAQTINAADRRDDDDIATLQKRRRRRVAQLFNRFVDLRVLFDIGIRRGNVSLRLVIIVIADKIFHSVVREKRLELTVKLRRQRFVRLKDQRRPIRLGDQIRHRERFAAACHAQERLPMVAQIQSFKQRLDRLRLVARRLKWRHQFKICHVVHPCPV